MATCHQATAVAGTAVVGQRMRSACTSFQQRASPSKASAVPKDTLTQTAPEPRVRYPAGKINRDEPLPGKGNMPTLVVMFSASAVMTDGVCPGR